jgi:Flavin containing amine oxidoreductase
LQTTVTKIDYDYSNATTPNYKVKVDVTKSSSNSSINATSRLCNHYLANYVILTVPEAVLERNLIAFEPTLRKPTGPSTAGLYIKLFYKFNVRVGPAYNREFAMTVLNGPGSTDNNDQCIFWHNMDGTSSTTNGGLGTSTRFIPGSNIWICTLVTEAFEKLVQGGSGNGQRLSNATIDRLLDPLRKVFQTNITTPDYTSYYADWNFRDAFGRSAYSRWRIGATLADYADFYGGYGDIGGSKCQHNGCDRQNKWRLHLSGTFSCLKSYGVVWGAYNAGQRSARNVLAERGGGNTSIDSRFAACDDLGRSRFFPVLFGN